MSFLFVPTPQLVAKEDALPGRAEPILEPKPHAVLGTPITGPWKEGQRSLLVALGFSVDSRGSLRVNADATFFSSLANVGAVEAIRQLNVLEHLIRGSARGR